MGARFRDATLVAKPARLCFKYEILGCFFNSRGRTAMATTIKMTDVKVDKDSVTVHGEGGKALANSLVQKNGTTLAELSEKFGLVQPHEISIGGNGAVQIANAKVAARVATLNRAAAAADGFFDTNCQCGGGGGAASW
jgi:hypothetical protein